MRHAARVTLPVLALAVGVASTVIVAAPDRVMTTYAAARPAAAAAELGVGWALLVVGCVVWLSPATGSIGVLVTSTGVVWLAPVWVGWDLGPVPARSTAMLVPPLLVALLVHLTFASPGGRLTTPAGRRLIGICYAVAISVSVGRALVYDLFYDPDCWANCVGNSLLLRSAPAAARTLESIGLGLTVGSAAVITAVAVWRVVHATPAGRTTLGVVLAGIVAAAWAEAIHAAVLLRDPAEDRKLVSFMSAFLIRAAGSGLLALGFAWALLRQHRRRSAVARLATDLGAAPSLGSLRAALARTLRDDHLDIGYRLAGSPGYVDVTGRPFRQSPLPGQAITAIHRHGEPVALIVHDRALRDEPGLQAQIGAATRLAIDNERLRASLLARLQDLRSSRARIVETADRTRRQLERDLHDGAQQRLLAVMYELQSARSAADPVVLDTALVEMRAALAELRDIAHGIFPAVLDEAGLDAALWTLAETAHVPVAIDGVPAERLPGAVERAVYAVIRYAVNEPSPDPSRQHRVTVERGAEQVLVVVEGFTGSAPEHLADRVVALGGQVTCDQRQLRAEIPCDWS